MESDWEHSADCIFALARGGDDEKAWAGAALVAEFLHLTTRYMKGSE